MVKLVHVVRQMKTEKERLTRELRGITAALAAFGASYSTGRRLSAAAKERIAVAQRARWAKVKSGQKQNVGAAPKKRTISAAARKKIADAQRARWAKIKAQKKSA